MQFGINALLITLVLVLSGSIGTLVWLNDHRTLSHRLFFGIIILADLWTVLSIVSFTTGIPHLAVRVTSDLSAAASYALVLCCLLFSDAFLNGRISRWVSHGLLPLSVPLLILFGSNYTCGHLDAAQNCQGGNAYNGMILLILVLLILIVRNCLAGTRSQDIFIARQARMMTLGLGLAIGTGVLFGYVFPLINITAFNRYYSLATLIFVLFTAYAIIKHKLFNVRLVVARAIGYVLTLTVLASAFGVLVFGVSKLLFHLEISVWAQIVISAATALAALTFSRLKAFFDRVSNNLFYQDAYDAQELLDNLNRLFVDNTDLEQMLRKCASLIDQNLRAEYCYFGIKESANTPQRVIGHGTHRTLRLSDIERVRATTPHIHQKVIVTEELNPAHDKLRRILQENDIAVICRLTALTNQTVEGMGYLVLGPRRSGNPYTGQDLRLLEIIVNELVIAIENSLRFEEIRHFNETLQRNVNQATHELRRTNDKLRQLDDTKDEFITMASHQLRTPLTSVKGYLSMVLEGDAGKLSAQQAKLLSQSYASAQRMVFLISDLLNLSRLNTGKFVIEPSPVDLREVVQAEIEQVAGTAESREVTLTYERPASFPKLMLDETKVHQVVMNFIDNAIYYTRPGGKVVVSLTETPTAVEYRVTDTGIGVPRAVQHRLFTKFYRADNAQRARPDGTGLGLFMAKKVILAQGGSIIFESEENVGSTFGFRFNKTRHAVAA